MAFYNRKRRGDFAGSSAKRSRAGDDGDAGSSVGGASKIAQIDDEGNTYWEISNKRRITISDFKGKTFIGIREYYEKDGKDMPGKKGISLSVDQFSALIDILPQLDTQLAAVGQRIRRLDYDGTVSVPAPPATKPSAAAAAVAVAAAKKSNKEEVLPSGAKSEAFVRDEDDEDEPEPEPEPEEATAEKNVKAEATKLSKASQEADEQRLREVEAALELGSDESEED